MDVWRKSKYILKSQTLESLGELFEFKKHFAIFSDFYIYLFPLTGTLKDQNAVSETPNWDFVVTYSNQFLKK